MKRSKPSKLFRFLLLTAAVGLPWMPSALTRFSVNNPSAVTVTWEGPVAGSVVSNRITLSATASSTAAPISRVEFYCDGKLIGIVNGSNQPIALPPTSFDVR